MGKEKNISKKDLYLQSVADIFKSIDELESIKNDSVDSSTMLSGHISALIFIRDNYASESSDEFVEKINSYINKYN